MSIVPGHWPLLLAPWNLASFVEATTPTSVIALSVDSDDLVASRLRFLTTPFISSIEATGADEMLVAPEKAGMRNQGRAHESFLGNAVL